MCEGIRGAKSLTGSSGGLSRFEEEVRANGCVILGYSGFNYSLVLNENRKAFMINIL